MSNQLANKLNPRVKNLWRISDSINVLIGAVVGAFPLFIFSLFIKPIFASLLTTWYLVAIALALIVVALVLPPIRYARWSFELSDDYLEIQKGIIWRKRYTIPFIRVQDTNTEQGPIARMFGLSTVTISTAAAAHKIPGIPDQRAEELRDYAAELARAAREDV